MSQPADTRFLPTPTAIREQLAASLADADSADVAVAYVRHAWVDAFAGFEGKARVVCWLRCPNTDPFAVEQLTKRPHTKVRHLDGMHAKVYLRKGTGGQVITGSANLSQPALGLCGFASEAAIWSVREDVVAAASGWFDDLWASADPVTAEALAAAQAVWKPPAGPKGKKKVTSLPDKLPKKLVALAAKASKEDLAAYKESWALVQKLNPGKLTASDIEKLHEYLGAWMKHPSTFDPLLSQDPAFVGAAMARVFDEGVDIVDRMRAVHKDGDLKVPGLALPSWTAILHWRKPLLYPLYDAPTQDFLRTFKLGGDLAKGSLSPVKYGRWLEFAEILTQQLKLPSRGHVDRMVWALTGRE